MLFLAPGGKTAYAGQQPRSARRWAPPTGPTCSPGSPPTPTRPTASLLTRCRAEAPPAAAPAASPSVVAARAVPAAAAGRPPWPAARCRLIVADRGYFLFLAVLPFVLGTLALLVPGHVGLGVANPRGEPPTSRRRSCFCSASARSSWAPR